MGEVGLRSSQVQCQCSSQQPPPIRAARPLFQTPPSPSASQEAAWVMRVKQQEPRQLEGPTPLFRSLGPGTSQPSGHGPHTSVGGLG